MGTVSLIARTAHYYRRTRKPGEHYQATPAHARLLVRLKHADYAPTDAPEPAHKPEQPKPLKREYKRRDMPAAVETPVTVTLDLPDAPSTYPTYPTINITDLKTEE